VPYHITLCSYSLDNENYLISFLEDINHKFAQINVSFSGIGLFGLNVLFVNPNMSKKLAELYDYAKEKSLHRDNDLAAHITLLMDDPENILKVLPKIAGEFSAFSGKIKYLSLYEFFPIRFIKRIELHE
jgi:hypothetical protein